MEVYFKALAWTLVHSLWQGLLAALLAALIIAATRKTTARLRYNLLALVFGSLFITTLVTFFSYVNQGVPSLEVGSNASQLPGAVDTVPVQSDPGSSITAWLDSNSSLMLMIWSFFFSVNCLKLITGLAAVNRLRHYKAYAVDDRWKSRIGELQALLQVHQTIRLLQSELVKVPVAIGLLKPVILVPVGFFSNIPIEQVEAILLHELSHIKRKDYLVNLLQRFVEAVFFFNPSFVWISSLLRQEREACCDDMVVECTGEKKTYLNALVSFEEYSITHPTYAMGLYNRKHYLLNRVKRIVNNENNRLSIVEKIALLAGIVLFSAFTYLSNKKETVGASLSITVEQVPNSNASTVPFSGTARNIPLTGAVEQRRKPNVRMTKAHADTIPVGYGKPRLADTATKKRSADEVLQEIQMIKDQIGVKKNSIGEKKEKLKAVAKDSEQEKALKDQIEKERNAVEFERGQLEEKRKQLDVIRKQEWTEKMSTNQEEKSETKQEGKNERKNELKKRVDLKINKLRVEEKRIEKKELNEVRIEERKSTQIHKPGKIESRRIGKKIIFNTEKAQLFRDEKISLFKKHIVLVPTKVAPPPGIKKDKIDELSDKIEKAGAKPDPTIKKPLPPPPPQGEPVKPSAPPLKDPSPPVKH